jgi:threonine dehydratase
MYRAWSEGHLDPDDRMETFAEGVATQVPFALTMDVLRDHLDDFRLVSEETIKRGVQDLFTDERIITEGACTTSLAAMRQRRDELQGQTVVLPISGRNISPEALEQILSDASVER